MNLEYFKIKAKKIKNNSNKVNKYWHGTNNNNNNRITIILLVIVK
jgi:hypothetical protein